MKFPNLFKKSVPAEIQDILDYVEFLNNYVKDKQIEYANKIHQFEQVEADLEQVKKDIEFALLLSYRELPRMITEEFSKEVPETVFEKQERYKGKAGKDLIDRWAEEKTPDEFRAAMIFSMEKYQMRYGKKDDRVIEARKIADYANRLLEYELNMAS